MSRIAPFRPVWLLVALTVPSGAQGTSSSVPTHDDLQGAGVAPQLRREAPPLVLAPVSLDFADQTTGVPAADREIVLRNEGGGPVTVESVGWIGSGAGEFSVAHPSSVPFVLAPDAEEVLTVGFLPTADGGHDARLEVQHSGAQASLVRARVQGFGLGPVGDEIRMNVGGGPYVDGDTNAWSGDWGGGGAASTLFSTPDPIAQTGEDVLYQSARVGASFGYSLPVPDGWYAATLHFAETFVGSDGERVFAVALEGAAAIQGLDLFAVAGHDVAHSETFQVEVVDGRLDAQLTATTGAASLSALEVHAVPFLALSPDGIDFEGVAEGGSDTVDLTLTNAGALPLTVEEVGIAPFAGDSAAPFSLDFDGAVLQGAATPASFAVSRTLQPDESLVVPVTFAPAAHDVFQAIVEFGGPDFEAASTLVHGLAGSGHPFLHVVIESPPFVVDYDIDGFASPALDGTLSHTHEFGHSLVGFDWTEGGSSLGSAPVLMPTLAVGEHTVTLTITDDNDPAETLAGSVDVTVAPSDAVPGVMVSYYDGSSTAPSTLIDAVPGTPDFVELRDSWGVQDDGTAGGSPFTEDVMVVMEGDVLFDQEATWVVLPSGGDDRRLFVDGAPITTAVFLAEGVHSIEARFAVTDLGTLPLRVQRAVQGSRLMQIPPSATTHDESALAPLINSMPGVGSVLGGNAIAIEGVGFFPESSVVVHWGDTELTGIDLDSVAPGRIELTTPPAPAGPVSVTVETPNGVSPARTYDYTEDGPVPIVFVVADSHFVANPTTAAWGPDGRLYVASRYGQLTAFELDEDWDVVASQSYVGVSDDFPHNEILGITFDPFDDPEDPVRIYVAHNELFAQGGSTFEGPAPYDGQVSVLEGPSFDVPIPLVTSLPLSNHDHGVNGMQFDNNGDLLITVGGNTNAGIQWPTIGNIPASPFSGAIVKAETSKPDFDGEIVYVDAETGLPDEHSDDMVYGLEHAVQEGVDVHVHAPGLRNAYDVVYTTRRRLYATDNGPNGSFGPASTGPGTQGPHPQKPDELVLVEYDHYYGHPNHSRAKHPGEEREYVYRAPEAPSIPRDHTAPLAIVASSTDGLIEYRSRSFGGQMLGDLLMQQWGNYLRRAQLSGDGRSVTQVSQLFWTGALDVVSGAGGALLAINYNASNFKVWVPDDPSLVGLRALDVHPWRGPAAGGTRFVLGGFGFGNLAETSVTFGGVSAGLQSVTPTRIVGTVPDGGALRGLVDVVVTVDDGTPENDTLAEAFYYLYPKGADPGFWETRAALPVALGDTAAAAIGGRVYAIGEGDAGTWRFDPVAGTWSGPLAARPYPGSHHAAVAHDGRLYVVGGLGGGSAGRVQVYDPALDAWSEGAPLPWAGGSVQVARIDGLLYAAGGIVGSTTVDDCAVYDPELDQWTALASMPAGEGRNDAAAGTDGEKLWIFGGRGLGSGPCNCVANGFDTVHVYDPAADTWESSLDPGSALAELPAGRGGTGAAVYHQGEFWVLGGETLSSPGATPDGVYARVDAYDPETNTWRRDADMPVPRHGHAPVVCGGLIHVVGGGTTSGGSTSNVHDVLNHQ